MRVTNQKPAILTPVYKAKLSGDMDVGDYIRQTLATPLYTPLVAGQPVQITENNHPINEDTIIEYVYKCCDDVIDPIAEGWCKTLYKHSLVYFDDKCDLAVQNLFAIQSGAKEKLPFPTPKVVYTPATDVIPVSKEFLAGQCEYDKYFATMAFYTRSNTLGFYFANETAFDSFKAWLATQVQLLVNNMTPDTVQMFSDFQTKIKLDGLTESLKLRNTVQDNNEEYSFARVIIGAMMNYTTQVSNAEFGVLPFSLSELYCPKSVVFVNVEKHSHASAKQVADEWNIINQSLQMQLNLLTKGQISRLTANARQLNKMKGLAAYAASNAAKQAERSIAVAFRKTAPTSIDLARIITKVISKMKTVNMSENSYKSVKMTFQKPNRRNPDDFNKQGKSVSTKYKPDIHIYLDTSGSISERNYQDAVKALIVMARKLNVNLYFNSFSHVMSTSTKLNTKNKSVAGVYAEFQKVPKVSGGTDYQQIWNYINRDKKRKRELSLIITDFEWYPPSYFVQHPKNLYYLPCSNMDWDDMVQSAKEFVARMPHIDPLIRKKLLF